MRVLFMGTSPLSATILEGLVGAGYQIVEVYTRPDKPAGRGKKTTPPPAKEAASSLGLAVYQPTTLKPLAEVQRVRDLRPDIIVLAAYGKIIPQEILDLPPLGCINVHPSLLPRHRGPSPIATAILEGDQETGDTIFLMDAGMDTGPILAQERLPIGPSDTGESLSQRLADLGRRLLLETLPPWATGEIKPRPQDHSLATYTRLLKKEDGDLDWRRPAVELWRQVRAFQPWPGSYTFWRGKLLKVLEAQPQAAPAQAEAGRVLLLPTQGERWPAVQTGEGLLVLRRLQLEGRRPLPAPQFLLGERGLVGDLVGRG